MNCSGGSCSIAGSPIGRQVGETVFCRGCSKLTNECKCKKKLLVAGGRDMWLSREGFEYLDSVIQKYKIDCIIQGGAKGIDSAAKNWAKYKNIPCMTVKAEWDLYGKRAGYLRNEKMSNMLHSDDIVLVFRGGRGSKMMLDIAVSKNFLVLDCMNLYEYVRPINILELTCNLCNNPICTGLTCTDND